VADEDRGLAAVAEELGVEFQADQEEEEDYTDLAEGVEVLNALIGKDSLERSGKEQTEKAGAEHDAGDHFPHHLRLAKADEQKPHDPAEAEDQAYLDDQKENEISGLHSAGATATILAGLIVMEEGCLVLFVLVDMFLMAGMDRN